ncbi:hypothetical protein [Psychroserpens ponticola]|uniref:DNA-directed DNA polymerase family A palm domain-containing protein n=1 Tax=Psychroserpens ponticola TaxID=2932268 RepID=A0ABY7S4T0_9FLAO|nr:hypothetical protein [Psychroserpens ponticola]WCO02910.1 hypothetical protein MUN68_005305 [Psychroserpens ponticola]
MRLYIPENLDIDQLMYDNPPNFKKYKCKTDKLLYIIHLINALPLMNKDLLYEGYVPLNATMLQSKISNYKEYLDYLLNDLKIIESDGQYFPGYKSKGYRLIEEYKTEIVSVSIREQVFSNTLKVHRNRIKASVTHLDYLTKWFDDKLQIDIDYVNEFLKEEFKLKENNDALRDYDRSRKKFKEPIAQLNHAKISAEKINRGEYYLMHDSNVYRFHSNLTNMRSVVRNAITYDGQKLISIDIKNSQPYLSTILLSRSFWIEQKNEPNQEKSLSISFNEPKSCHNYAFNDINTNKYKGVNEIDDRMNISQIKIHDSDSYIMLGDIDKTLMNKEFSQYINLVVSGTLYEFLEQQFSQCLGETFSNRKEVKTAVFQVLFTDNRFLGQEEAKPKKMFKEMFPYVYEVFRQIKSKDKSLLPRLLQSIESYLMINVIAKRISEEYPDAFICTIHDSISTTEEYVDVVEQIMIEELSKAIGHPPKLAREEWCKSNMVKHLGALKEKARVVA